MMIPRQREAAVRKTLFQLTDVFDRTGFEDGDILADLLADAKIGDDYHMDDTEHLSLKHAVLAAIVETLIQQTGARLGLPPIPLYRVSTIHNPIRFDGSADEADELRSQWSEVSAKMADRDILRIAQTLAEIRRARAEGELGTGRLLN